MIEAAKMKNLNKFWGVGPGQYVVQNPPAPKVLGRDLPDGTRKRLHVFLGGGAFFGQNLLFLIGREGPEADF